MYHKYQEQTKKSYVMFLGIFQYLLKKALKTVRLKMSKEEREYIKNIQILDSILIKLCLEYFGWAEYRKERRSNKNTHDF